MKGSLKLQTDSILQVPLSNYKENFTFIVNNKEFPTNKFSADLLSPKISKFHRTDPTLSQYTINTEAKGNFQYFIDLLNFETTDIDEKNIDFICEIIEELSIDYIDINVTRTQISKENVIQLIESHSKFRRFYSKELNDEIDFLSEHLYELNEEEENSLSKLSYDILEKVLNNDKLHIDTEDQLLRIVNKLYMNDKEFCPFYEFVLFANVEKEAIEEFVSVIDIDRMTIGTWRELCKRLVGINDEEEDKKGRYEKRKEKKKEKKGKDILYSSGNLKGIFANLREQSNIDDEVSVTASSGPSGDKKLLLDIENTSNDFCTGNNPNSWICFEFKQHTVIPTNYTIRTYGGGHHPRSWVIEGSVTGSDWDPLDEEKECRHLNKAKTVHTFGIKNEQMKEFKYIRMKLTGKNWCNYDYLEMCSIEFYGKLI